MDEHKISLEERLGHLEELLDKMEDGEVSLEDSFRLYKDGLEEIKAANDMLDEMERAMLVLTDEGEVEEF